MIVKSVLECDFEALLQKVEACEIPHPQPSAAQIVQGVSQGRLIVAPAGAGDCLHGPFHRRVEVLGQHCQLRHVRVGHRQRI